MAAAPRGLPLVERKEVVSAGALDSQFSVGVGADSALQSVSERLKGLRPLRDPAVFARAEVGEGGHSVVWSGDLDMGAARVLPRLQELLDEVDHSAAPAGAADLLIRTGAEKRLGDFLLWQCAYVTRAAEAVREGGGGG